MAEEYTPPATQEELDAIVGARLKREREKYADYDELKAPAAKAAETDAASRRELEQAREEVARLKREEAARLAGGVVSGYIVYRMTHRDDKPPKSGPRHLRG